MIGDGKGVIDPTIPISTAWDLLVTFFLCTTIITMPLSLGFDRINDALFDWNAVVRAVVNALLIGRAHIRTARRVSVPPPPPPLSPPPPPPPPPSPLPPPPLPPPPLTATIAALFKVDFIFITDVVKQFHTGFINSHGFIILDKKKIQSVYFRSWFFPGTTRSDVTSYHITPPSPARHGTPRHATPRHQRTVQIYSVRSRSTPYSVGRAPSSWQRGLAMKLKC